MVVQYYPMDEADESLVFPVVISDARSLVKKLMSHWFFPMVFV